LFLRKSIKMIKKGINYLFIIYIITLLVGIVMPDLHFYKKIGIGIFRFRIDYWLHCFSFYGLCFLFISKEYIGSGNLISKAPIRKAWLLLFLTPATEMLQFFIPGRSVSLKDVFANSLGIFLCIFSYYMLRYLIVWIFTKTHIIDKIRLACSENKVETKAESKVISMSLEPVIAKS
jgi:hypothetical protein